MIVGNYQYGWALGMISWTTCMIVIIGTIIQVFLVTMAGTRGQKWLHARRIQRDTLKILDGVGGITVEWWLAADWSDWGGDVITVTNISVLGYDGIFETPVLRRGVYVGFGDCYTCVTIDVCDVPNLMDAKRIMML